MYRVLKAFKDSNGMYWTPGDSYPVDQDFARLVDEGFIAAPDKLPDPLPGNVQAGQRPAMPGVQQRDHTVPEAAEPEPELGPEPGSEPEPGAFPKGRKGRQE